MNTDTKKILNLLAQHKQLTLKEDISKITHDSELTEFIIAIYQLGMKHKSDEIETYLNDFILKFKHFFFVTNKD